MSNAIDGDSNTKLTSGRKGWADVASDIVAAARGAASDNRRLFYRNLTGFRAKDRVAAQRVEVGPLTLRKLRAHYTFAGFVALCATVVAVVSFIPGAPQQIYNVVNNIIVNVTRQEPPPQGSSPITKPSEVLAAAPRPESTTVEVPVQKPVEVLTKTLEDAVKPPAPPSSNPRPSDAPLDPGTKAVLRSIGL